MASIIKKQILKHLSKFTKNLSADKINVSTLRGEGELSNLELDCVALQNLMNLPTWLEFKCANCNKVSVKIPWTKLKTTPICIFLDNVEVEMVTCEKPREPNGPSPIQASASSGDTSYGFTEKVLEGMTVNINSISINFSSAAFHATFQLSQLLVISTNPKWVQSDLRSSRITDKTLGQVLTFKKISWQTMRIVADAITASDKTNITPVRLITNLSEIKMVFRRRTSDCAILASQLQLHFDDLLWVLTDSQVQSALLCVKSLRDTIERSSQQMRDLGLVKPHDTQVPAKPPPTTTLDTEDQSSSADFSRYTVIETSIHLDFDRVDLHICEEGTPVHKSRRRGNLEGGAIQIALHNLKVDHYPYHKAASDREHFRDWGDTMKERNSWADSIIKRFRKDFVELKKAAEAAGNLRINPANKRPSKLSENCLSVRLTDIDIHKVTTSSSKKQESGRLFNSTRKELLLPDEMPLFHFIRTEYYYPDGRDYPAPHNNIFMQLNAPQLRAYWDSLVWLDALATTTVQAVQKMLEDLGIIQKEEEEEDADAPEKEADEEHVDIRIQVLMPKIFVPGPPSTDLLKPYGLEIQVSRAAITNCRDGTDCSRTHLGYILKKAEKQHFSRNPEAFPGEKGFDMPFMQDVLRQHADGDDLPLRITQQKGNAALTGNALKTTSAKDVWAIDLEQVWIDFVMPGADRKSTKTFEYDGDASSGGFLGLDKPGDDPISNGLHLPFLDSFPVMLWISKTSVAESVSKLAAAGLSHASSLSASVENIPPFVNTAKEDDVSRSKSQTDISFTKCNGQVEGHHSPAFSCSTPDLRSKSIPRITSPTNSLDSGDGRPDSPRLGRNRRLLDYYRVNAEEEASSKEEDVRSVSTTSSATSRRNKTTATHIVIHTDKSLRLQLDHHQYIFLLRLIDTVEDVGNRLEQNSERILNSTPSSTASTPSHSISGDDTFSTNRIRKKKPKPTEVSSVRLSAPAADLFIVLRPPPNSDTKVTHLETESTKASTPVRTKPDSARSSPVENQATELSSSSGKKVTSSSESHTTPPAHPQLIKAASVAHETPPVSECSSDNVSMVGSDTVSIFGDLSGIGNAVYPHSDPAPGDSHSSSPVNQQFAAYPHEESDNDTAQLIPKEEALPQDTIGDKISFSRLKEAAYEEPSSFIRQKSGSLSLLSNPATSVPDESKPVKRPPHRNHSSGNLTLSAKHLQESSSSNSLTVVKSGSSGYESGSRESLSPVKGKNLAQPSSSSSPRSTHSHSSSDASDQFVMIQVDENGKGLEESSTIRIVRKQKVLSSSPSIQSETSSIASNKSMSANSEIASKSELEQDSMSSCGMADSQITVTNAKSTSSLESESSSDNEPNTSNHLANGTGELQNKEKAPVPDLSSLLHLHVSGGIGLAVDSNNLSDSVVRIAATTLNIMELGVLKTEKIENTFIDNTPKKIEASLSTNRLKRSDESLPQVCLRIDSGPLAQRFSEAAVKEGHIQVGAKNLPLCLNSSTLANLGAFLEDEVMPKVVPMRIEAQDVELTIKDDMPPAYDVTPPAPPITLNVCKASVLRSDDGTFHVTTSSTYDSPTKPQASGTVGTVDSPLVNSKNMVDQSTDTEDLVLVEEGSGAEVPVSKQNGTISHTEEDKSSEIEHKPGAPDVNGVSSATVKTGLSNGTGIPKTDDPSVIEDLLDQIKALQMERDSLAGALRYMQEELISSERERSNLRAQVN